MAALYVLVAVLGLVIGSFLNVVIHRVPRNESLVRPASRCPHCGAAVRPWHNVPVLGWLLLRGRCADCGTRVSARYPLVEAGTAVLFVVVAARFGWSRELPAYLYLAAIGVALAAIDVAVRRLPDRIVLPSYLVGGALLAVASRDWATALRAVVGMAALFCFYFALAWFRPGGMGYGDVKLAGLLGLYLGWLGWNTVLVGTFAGFTFGAVTGLALMALRRAGRRSALPFGPYMLAGALVALFFAAPVATWYTGLLTPLGAT
jgi:leader peptidase (prepilin peptidase)/N-methyltransferase